MLNPMANTYEQIEVAVSQADASAASQTPPVHVRLKVVPGASRPRVVGMLGQRLKVTVAAAPEAPEAGKANKAVCVLLADTLDVAKKEVILVQGPTQPLKTIAVHGLSMHQVISRLTQAV